MTFCDGNTSSYKINVVKFVISLALLNKKSYMNSEFKKKKKKKSKTKEYTSEMGENMRQEQKYLRDFLKE